MRRGRGLETPCAPSVAAHTSFVILLFPLLLVVAVAVAVRAERDDGRGWRWFAAWAVAGLAFTFSLLTGFSIGLLLFPLAATALLAVAARAPHLAESVGFLAGVAATFLAVSIVSWGDDTDAAKWLGSGAGLAACAIGAYAAARRHPPPANSGRASA